MTQENTLARYTLLHELGRGAISAVYAARDQATGATVALKTLDPALLKSEPNFADRFLKHARSARLLRHRNIATIQDAGKAGGTAYAAMEMGESLRKILDNGPLPVARAIQIARDIASGLAHAHLEGVVHGGLKPSNIIVLPSGVAKITDFGVSQAALRPGAQAGCMSYLSPEQVRGDTVDHRSDMFSLGALLYEMLAHRAPFQGGSAKEIMEKILRGKPPPPSELNLHVPRTVDAIVLSMLAAQPVVRIPGAPILLRDLQGLEEGLGLGPTASAGSDEAKASVPPPEPEPEARPMPGVKRFRDRAPMREEPQLPNRITDSEAFDYHKAMVVMERESRRQRSFAWRPPLFATLVLAIAVLGVGLGAFMYYSPGRTERAIAASRMQDALASAAGAQAEQAPPDIDAKPMSPQVLPPEPKPLAQTDNIPAPSSEQPAERVAAAAMEEAPSTAPRADAKPARMESLPTKPDPVVQTENRVSPASEQIAEPRIASARMEETAAIAPDSDVKPTPPEARAEKPRPLPRTVSSVPRASEQPASAVAKPASADAEPASAGAAPARERPRAMQPAAKVPKQQPTRTARLILAVSPRGEIYIDGKHHGTTPPMTTFDLEPGMHRIEVRSGSRTPYLTYMTLEAGDVRRIRHDFDVSRAVHPPRSSSWRSSERAAR